jgi:hypothetical protein
MTPVLPSWTDGSARDEVIDFVRRVTDEESSAYVPPSGRIAVFDNDGAPWCEKPGPIQAEFLFRQLARMAERDPALAMEGGAGARLCVAQC